MDEVAGCRKFLDARDRKPRTAENAFSFQVELFLRGTEGAGNRTVVEVEVCCPEPVPPADLRQFVHRAPLVTFGISCRKSCLFLPSLSIGAQQGPPICVHNGPLWRAA